MNSGANILPNPSVDIPPLMNARRVQLITQGTVPYILKTIWEVRYDMKIMSD